uniref:DUF7041 domain-containing protein n=1 Tax=Octopus bimaculoides TaxID=37653 RepID=A0A0L8H3G1_OCTBM
MGDKYLHVVAALDKETATRVLDILTHLQPTKKYAILKDRLVDTFQRSEREAAAKILEEELGDSKPSELMDRMLALVSPGESPSLLFKEIFLRKLPPQIQAIITQTEIKDMRQLAKAADRHFLSSGVLVNAIGSAPRRGRFKHDDLCSYHAMFGKKATKCKQPCSFRTPSPETQGLEDMWR